MVFEAGGKTLAPCLPMFPPRTEDNVDRLLDITVLHVFTSIS